VASSDANQNDSGGNQDGDSLKLTDHRRHALPQLAGVDALQPMPFSQWMFQKHLPGWLVLRPAMRTGTPRPA
jgi:hypothetical protein